MTDERIKDLESKGFKRWKNGNMDRLYINAAQLGLVCSYYNTGNIHSAEFRGDEISNAEGRRMKAAKTFVDVSTEKVYSNNERLRKAAMELAGIKEDE